jgi:hypothetical protein
MSDNTMQMPKFTVKLVNEKEPFTVLVTNGAQIQWDIARGKNDWGPMEENGNLWAGFVAFISAKREGKIDLNMPWDTWMDLVEYVQFEDNVDAAPFPEGEQGAAGSGTGDSNEDGVE